MMSLTAALHPTFTAAQIKLRSLRSQVTNPHLGFNASRIFIRRLPNCCMKLTPWEPTPVTYAPTDEADPEFLERTPDIFGAAESEYNVPAPVTSTEELTGATNKPLAEVHLFKLPMWVLGPSLLLTTGMVPTLWLPISSIYLGPNIASLLSLIGLDCIFNLGATLFLLMADSCARPKDLMQPYKSKAPFSYQFWNMLASVMGYIVPLTLFFGSQNGFLQPQLSYISFSVLLGPYLLLLSVQILTESLTWYWQSPVWLVTPVVYEAYRVLQLMRGLKLSAELSVPAWTVHTIRGLVCWWVLILGLQLMRVAWFAGFTAKVHRQQQSVNADFT
ncbi:hypothetical protein Ancab_037697 [Ancistrocladus abbreviatus]